MLTHIVSLHVKSSDSASYTILHPVSIPLRATRLVIRFHTMAVTRLRKVVKTEVEVVTQASKVKKIAKTAKVTRTTTDVEFTVPKLKLGKLNIEELMKCEIPDDLKLPDAFVEFHDAEFVAGINHILQMDRSLYPVVVHLNFKAFEKIDVPEKLDTEVIDDYWYALISSVIGQQISGSAARAIEARFKEMFDGKPSPAETMKKTVDELRAVGLLGQKTKYVYHISETFANGGKLTDLLFYRDCTKDELLTELTFLKGVGEWSAKMFSVFTLKEIDIFAHDDLGVARGVSRYLGNRPELLRQVTTGANALDDFKKALKKKGKFLKESTKRDWTPLHDQYARYLGLMFAPYQLVFMLIMWRLASTNIDILENVR